MEFDNSFDVPLSPAQAWAVLMDIRRIAPCMPGAALTEVVDAQNFRGKIAVRLGPVALAFAGRVQFEDIDEANHSARVKAQGTRRQGPRLGQCHGDVPHRARRYRLAGVHPYRPDAVRRGGAIRPRRRHDPGDRGANHRPVRRAICARSSSGNPRRQRPMCRRRRSCRSERLSRCAPRRCRRAPRGHRRHRKCRRFRPPSRSRASRCSPASSGNRSALCSAAEKISYHSASSARDHGTIAKRSAAP